MPVTSTSLLSPERRAEVSADPAVGGGNLLRSAIAVSPDPENRFIRAARPLVDTDGRERHGFSLADLDRIAQSWSAWYLEHGVQPRDRVAIYIDDSFSYMLHFCALSQIGAIPVLINSYAPPSIALNLIERTEPVGLYTTGARLEDLGDEVRASQIRWIRTAEEVPAPPARHLPETARFPHVDGDPVTILHSSGTTGFPKPVTLTHRSITAGPRFRLANHTEMPGELMLCAVPQSHFGCIAYMSYAILAGTPIVAAPDLPGDSLARTIDEYRPTTVMSFGHAYSELAAADLPAGILDSVNAWVSVGDAVHRAHILKVLAARGQDRPEPAFYDLLGCTELGWGSLVQRWTLEQQPKDRSAGRPVGVSEMRVLRTDGTETSPYEVGFLGARGPAITPGYWNDSAATYRGRIGEFCLTGDLAYRDEEGIFYQVDRTVDVVETANGTAYTVQMEELLLKAVAELRDCAVVGAADGADRFPVAVVKTATDADATVLLAECNQALRSAGHPELVLLEIAMTEEDFPIGVTGKVLKRTLREKYRSLSSYVRDISEKNFAVRRA